MARSARDLPPESSLARKAPNPGFGRGFLSHFRATIPQYPKIRHKKAQNNPLSKIFYYRGENISFNGNTLCKSGKYCLIMAV